MPGDILRIRAGERIPADCMVVKGETAVDTSPVTGESVPREARVGDEMYSGCINMTGLIEASVLRIPSESAAGRILKLTEEAGDRKTRSEAFITRFAKVYTPSVALLAALIALGVPLALLLVNGTPYADSLSEWSRRALSMLVISCPCALVISVPLGYFCGLGNASKKGILIKGSAFVDTLAKTEIAVFDKTGTLTNGRLSVSGVVSETDETEILKLAATAEKDSSHPIAKAICGSVADTYSVDSVSEISGVGVEAKLTDGRTVKVCRPERKTDATAVEIFVNGVSVGLILLSDELKPTTADALSKLKKMGIRKTVMLTGDRTEVAQSVAKSLGLDEFHAQLLPADKVTRVEELLEKQSEGTLAFVGDGINDAPVLTRADIGIAMGALGSDAAIESADVVLMDDKPSKIADSIKISRKTMNIVWQNIVFALGVKVIILLLGALGIANMWIAVFGDVGVLIIAILNSLRCMTLKK